jgi:N-acetylglutamate synthase-like GNAT family acetyltransferase
MIEIKTEDGKSIKDKVDPFYKANHKSHQARDNDVFFSAYKNQEIIGTVRFCIEENTPLLRSMMVSEDFRGTGIGRNLIKEFEKYLDQNKIQDTYCIAYAHLDYFYGIIGFKTISPEEAPKFLFERYESYLVDHSENEYIVMRRQHQ